MGENLKLVDSMAKVLQQARVVELVLCVAFVLVAHLLEGCDKAGSGSGAADVMGLNNESSGVFDKLPTPAPTPAPPPPTPTPPAPSKCCDSSQYGKCCACAAQSGAGFSAGFSICKTLRGMRWVQGAIIQVAAHEAQSHVVYISRIAEMGRVLACKTPHGNNVVTT